LSRVRGLRKSHTHLKCLPRQGLSWRGFVLADL
jgi:hypothetical protein